jgi:hypothetical protein
LESRRLIIPPDVPQWFSPSTGGFVNVKRLDMTWTPQRQGISAITQALPAVVTTAAAHGLTTGQAVRINVPKAYGMVEISGKIYSVTVLNNTTFSLQTSQVPFVVNVDSRSFTAFTTPAKPGFTAEMLPVGALPIQLTDTIPQARNNTAVSAYEDAIANNSTVNIPF